MQERDLLALVVEDFRSLTKVMEEDAQTREEEFSAVSRALANLRGEERPASVFAATQTPNPEAPEVPVTCDGGCQTEELGVVGCERGCQTEAVSTTTSAVQTSYHESQASLSTSSRCESHP